MRRPVRTLAVAAAGLLLASCGDDEPAQDTVTVTEQQAPSAPATTTESTERAEPDEPRAASPRRGCRRSSRAGAIDMNGVGSVRLRQRGDRLSVSRVRPADGWRESVERDDDRDEVEVDFRRGSREVELEAEIDDGRLEIEVCTGRRGEDDRDDDDDG